MSRPRKVRPYGDSNRSQIGEQYAGGISTLQCARYIGRHPHAPRWDSSGVVVLYRWISSQGQEHHVLDPYISARTVPGTGNPTSALPATMPHVSRRRRCITAWNQCRPCDVLAVHSCIHGSRAPTMTLRIYVRQSGRHLRYLSALYHSPTLGLLRPIIELPCDRSHTNISFEHHTDSRSPLWLPSSLVCSTPTLTARSRSSTP